jgi:hypothetical protein
MTHKRDLVGKVILALARPHQSKRETASALPLAVRVGSVKSPLRCLWPCVWPGILRLHPLTSSSCDSAMLIFVFPPSGEKNAKVEVNEPSVWEARKFLCFRL